jgi:hypothetical protein
VSTRKGAKRAFVERAKAGTTVLVLTVVSLQKDKYIGLYVRTEGLKREVRSNGCSRNSGKEEKLEGW